MKQICKFCKSEIDSECYVCPVCRQWLHPFRLKKDNPLLKKIIFFVLVFSAVIYLPRIIAVHYLEDRFISKEFQTAEKHNLVIVSQSTQKYKNRIIILGQIKNNGNDSFSSLTVEAELLDKNKKFIGLESGIVDGSLSPGETRSFKIVGCCEAEDVDNSLKELDSIKIRIVSGYLKKLNKEMK
jgi:hypothetical protein